VIRAANQHIEEHRPWELAAATGEPEAQNLFDEVIAGLIDASRRIAGLLEPFTPDLAERAQWLLAQESLAAAAPLYPRLEVEAL
jgi:methionyl-tRNA synthetase